MKIRRGVWIQIGSDIDGEAMNDQSGGAISISGNGQRVAIGAPFNNGNGALSGHVRVYEDQAGSWVQIGSDLDGEAANDFAGVAVSLSDNGQRVVIGAQNNSGNGSNSGHARVYEDQAGTWVQIGSDIDGEAAFDGSGVSVSISGDGLRVAIGAPNNDGNGSGSGHVRVYEDQAGTWVQIGIDIDGEAIDDQSGQSVSLSLDGSRVAIGANLNDGNGASSGHVRVYEDQAGSWVQIGTDMDGEAPGDFSGLPASISQNGDRVGIGAFGNDGTGTNSGHVRVYEFVTILPLTVHAFRHINHEESIELLWRALALESEFLVERSNDAVKFEQIGFVHEPHIDQNFRFIDEQPVYGTSYYRLTQTQSNGEIHFSNILIVHRNMSGIYIQAPAPNPTYALTYVPISTSVTSNLDVLIHNSVGELIAQQLITVSGEAQLPIDLSSLPSGSYLVSIYQQKEKIHQSLVYKN